MHIIDQVSEDLFEGHIYAGDICFIPHLRIVFSFISKNASTSLKTMLSQRLGPKGGYDLALNPHMAANSGFQNLNNIGAAAMDRFLLDPKVPKVTVVREPFDRLRSAYFSRVRRWAKNDFEGTGFHARRMALVSPMAGSVGGMHSVSIFHAGRFRPTFDELVDYVCKTPTGMLDRHLAPQAKLIAADRVRYDMIGKFEDLPKFWRDFNTMVGVDLGREKLIQRNSTEYSRLLENEAELRVRVEERYALDYETFSYATRGGK